MITLVGLAGAMDLLSPDAVLNSSFNVLTRPLNNFFGGTYPLDIIFFPRNILLRLVISSAMSRIVSAAAPNQGQIPYLNPYTGKCKV